MGPAQLGVTQGHSPPLLIGAGLWLLQPLVAGELRAARHALTVMSVAMFLFAAMTYAGQALGPPFEIFLLAPASVVAALTTDRKGPIRTVLGLIAAACCTALATALLPAEAHDSLGGFRIFGGIAYAGVGVLWPALGVTLLVTERGGRLGS